ncbi:MAG: hypothetical protein PHV68_05825 [Candidatus Gastranaerophilales bacterium]|nr:hypothetical protein [Candidatus Gastranaerophilales bacterium]
MKKILFTFVFLGLIFLPFANAKDVEVDDEKAKEALEKLIPKNDLDEPYKMTRREWLQSQIQDYLNITNSAEIFSACGVDMNNVSCELFVPENSPYEFVENKKEYLENQIKHVTNLYSWSSGLPINIEVKFIK